MHIWSVITTRVTICECQL